MNDVFIPIGKALNQMLKTDFRKLNDFTDFFSAQYEGDKLHMTSAFTFWITKQQQQIIAEIKIK